MDPVICCIVCNEDDYMDEFINHYLSIGFNKIYIYDNAPQPTNKDMHPYVQVIHYPGTFFGLQLSAYNHFLQHYASQHTHVGFFDADEFLLLKKHTNIKDLLNEYMGDRGGALCVNWVFYGSNGLTTKDDRPLKIRFTKRQTGVHEHIKCISRIKDIHSLPSPHFPNLKPSFHVYDTNGNIVHGHDNHIGDDRVMQLNHYYVKTPEEFKKKMAMPRADTGQPRPSEFHQKLWDAFDRNEVDDNPE